MDETVVELKQQKINGDHTLEPGVLHPMVYPACIFVNEIRLKKKRIWSAIKRSFIKENSISSLMCLETMYRIERDDNIDHIYVFGLAWAIFEFLSADPINKATSVRLS